MFCCQYSVSSSLVHSVEDASTLITHFCAWKPSKGPIGGILHTMRWFVLYGKRELAEQHHENISTLWSSRPMRAKPWYSWTNESGPGWSYRLIHNSCPVLSWAGEYMPHYYQPQGWSCKLFNKYHFLSDKSYLLGKVGLSQWKNLTKCFFLKYFLLDATFAIIWTKFCHKVFQKQNSKNQ